MRVLPDSRPRPPGARRLFLAVALATLAAPPGAREARASAEDGPLPLERDALVALAVRRAPGVRAGGHRAAAARLTAEAEAALPPPELAVDVWQVPFARPLALDDAQMVATGLRQTFPAPGARAARAAASAALADAASAEGRDVVREVTRDVEHALVDLAESGALEENHGAHRDLAARVEHAALARQAAGGSLADVAAARVDLAALEADAATQAAQSVRARARLNALLGRPFAAPFGGPARLADPTTTALAEPALLALALGARPELDAAAARDRSEAAGARAAAREAAWPMVTVGLSYYAPTSRMPEHGYGVSAALSLPWLQRGAARRADAGRAATGAAHLDVAEAQRRVAVDVASAAGAVGVAEARLRALATGATPAARRALDAVLAAYRAGQGDLGGVLRAERAVVDAETGTIAARAALEHALVELDWAAGARVPRAPLALGPEAAR